MKSEVMLAAKFIEIDRQQGAGKNTFLGADISPATTFHS
jgi:hypothetical protein